MTEPSGPLRRTLRWLWRSVVIGVAALAVAVPVYSWLGPPSNSRLYGRDELARFAPTLGHGLGQLIGETVLTGLIVYAARRWLRVRL